MSLFLPKSVLNQHLVVLGKTGAGKSSALRYIVEHLLDQGKRVCILDPKGDWWGLKASEDGKRAGYPVIAFGDFKEPKASDVPINQYSGAHIAELIATGNRPCIIGFRGWMTAHMVQFWINFASGIFNANSGELFLVGDEFHNFAPKGRIMDPQAGKCLHWSNRLLSEGRGLGIVCLLASQRPQKVHNDTLTSCETLVAMRVIHAADRNAVEEWIDGCGDKEHGKEVLNSLANMARGEAHVWSPEAGFGPKRVSFPMFKTFDSFAPPQMQKRVSTASWADVDLSVVKEKLASVIEEAKANDPEELKKRIRQLEAEVKKSTKVETQEVIREVVPQWVAEAFDGIRSKVREQLTGVGNAIDEATNHFRYKLKNLSPRESKGTKIGGGKTSAERPLTARTPAARDNNHSLDKCQTAILGVLKQFSEGCEIGKLALLSGYKVSGGFRNALSALRTSGLMEGDNIGTMRATDQGMKAADGLPDLPTGEALREYWLSNRNFGACEKAVLRVLIDSYPAGAVIETLAESAGYEVSGGFRNALSALRTAGVIVGRNTEAMKASPDLFNE